VPEIPRISAPGLELMSISTYTSTNPRVQDNEHDNANLKIDRQISRKLEIQFGAR